MRTIYGEDAEVIVADDYGRWRESQKTDGVTIGDEDVHIDSIVPWGWDSRLKQTLLKQGCPERLLPTDEWLEGVRQLQHRRTVLELQPHAVCVDSEDAAKEVIDKMGRVVLKAPWSGSGRGIRLVDSQLSDHDRHWVRRVVAMQGGIIVERRLLVKDDFAIEYYVDDDGVRFVSLSLFKTQSGVYRGNVLLSDEAIRQHLHLPHDIEVRYAEWLYEKILGKYNGYVGIDMIRTVDNEFYVCEMNLRHTMGIVAFARYKSQITNKKL